MEIVTKYVAPDGMEFALQSDCEQYERELAKQYVTEARDRDEWLVLGRFRGERATGYPMHVTKDGRFYFWCMGGQPASPVAGRTPAEASEAFLKLYEKGTTGNGSYGFVPPTHKAMVVPEAA